MKEKSTIREISNPLARAAMWLSIAFMLPMGCWHVYEAATKGESHLWFPGVTYLAMSILFFCGLTSNKRAE
jgi:hypothetical protein